MRTLYSLLWWLILPLALFRLWWRGRKEPGYRRHIAERLGYYPPARLRKNGIWIHAVSVGETRAAEPLVRALLSACPQKDILLTCMTPAGRTAGHELFGGIPRVTQAYLPYDTPLMMRRFIRHFTPGLCILMETEIWPNLINQCNKHRIPVALVNARLSERSLKKGQRLAPLIRPAAAGIQRVAAQTETDAARLAQFGSGSITVTGSVKFDVTPPEAAICQGKQLRRLIGSRPVLICASTRDGEEAQILDALGQLKPDNTLLILVPRHPRRFDEVAALIAGRKLRMVRRSELPGDFALAGPVPSGVRILLGDSMGEMFSYYAASDLAFIGGSLNPFGGQNLIEACALGLPVLTGKYTFNFEAITEDAVKQGAALRIASAPELMQQAASLFNRPEKRHEMGKKAQQFAFRQRGATERTIAVLTPLLADRQTIPATPRKE
ncbi:MAG: lipid IV(A) 3-deoxy-D-manno-octulosonic acid transferase [Oxalobacter formigenes]|nr:lipid IV(A) 3-deoxy-D-manno-octulosonic acid transferase [Oxalobacter formigenes]